MMESLKWEFTYRCRTHLMSSFDGLAIEIGYTPRHQYVLHLLNPATKKVFVLPDFRFHRGRQMYTGTFGIAHVVHSRQYKVALSYIYEDNDCIGWVLAILTVGVDQSWRYLSVAHLSKTSRSVLCLSPLVTEGYMHWAASNWTNFLTLDMENELLTEGEFPLPPIDYMNGRWSFLSTGRALSALVDHGNLVWEIWMMEQGGPEWKKLSVEINLGHLASRLQSICGEEMEILLPLGWIKYPKVLAFCLRGRSMCPLCICYDLDAFQIECLDFTIACAGFHAVVHKNSLIWFT